MAAEFGPAVAFTLLSQYEIWAGPIPHMGGSISGPKPVLSAVVALISVGLALRLRYPLLALVLAMGPFGAHGIVDHFIGKGGPNLFEVFLSQVFIVYSTAANTSGRRTYAGAAMVVALQLVGYGGLRITVPNPVPTDEEIQAQIDRLRDSFGSAGFEQTKQRVRLFVVGRHLRHGRRNDLQLIAGQLAIFH